MSSCAIGAISIGNPRSKLDGVSGMFPKFRASSGYRSSWIWLCSAFDLTARLLRTGSTGSELFETEARMLGRMRGATTGSATG